MCEGRDKKGGEGRDEKGGTEGCVRGGIRSSGVRGGTEGV